MSVLMFASIGVDAATMSLTPVADTTLQSAYPGHNFGGDSSFQAGGLLRFDFTSVPAGSTINSVSLTLAVTRTPSGGVSSLFDLHRVLESWGEGDNSGQGGLPADTNEAGWINRLSPSTRWTTPGGTFSPAVSASQMISGNGSYTFVSTVSLVSDVQLWVSNPSNNFGWELISENENLPTTIRRFGSRDAGASAPLLNIAYTPVPEPRSLWLILFGGFGFWWISRQRARLRIRRR